MNEILVTSLVGYGLSFVVFLVRRRKAGLAFFVAAWLVNATAVVLDWSLVGQPPFANMYHVLVFLAACFLPIYVLLMILRQLDWWSPDFPLVAAICLGGALMLEREALWRLPPALQSPWFVPHVTTYVVSYALAGLAFLRTMIVLWKRWGTQIGDTKKLERSSYEVLAFGFPLMTFGLLSGALWAEQAWGSYWSWDPKETWSLITWTLYLIYFHCRKTPSLRPYATAAQLLAFLALLTTFLLVNLLPGLGSTLHSYA